MTAGTSSRARWPWVVLAAGCLAALLLAAALTTGPRAPVAHTVAFRANPVLVSPGTAAGSRYAGRAQVFGLVTPGPDTAQVLFAPARRMQPGAPETVYPGDVQPYRPLRVAPDAQIRVTAPIALGDLPDYIRGITVTPERFSQLYREADQRYGPFLDRGHMFEVGFDGTGRVVRMQQIFSP
ncbi:hypothetical protein ACRYCC_18885 [Actinomadura scrupuli]|uniref:hypothetical protein n=1 Tax=Actinomadura scrupuli TaxID=559629 RepID=UPI003D977D08